MQSARASSFKRTIWKSHRGREEGGLISSFSHYYTSTLCIQDFSVFSSQNVKNKKMEIDAMPIIMVREDQKLIRDKTIPWTPAVTRISRK